MVLLSYGIMHLQKLRKCFVNTYQIRFCFITYLCHARACLMSFCSFS
uniref:Uncharacterized protein n=1 Tax=Rhizophora mucronata TaxID=61149 RepID=A0A2P2N938_RHIMU